MTRLNKSWVLPAPPRQKGQTWLPVVRIGRTVPFGYEQDPDDPDILLPIQKELELLEVAKKHLKRYSFREVANWLSKESGRNISHEGLRKRVSIESKRQREAANARLYSERAEKAARKAQEISSRIGGDQTRVPADNSP
jgi:hypothetical protein